MALMDSKINNKKMPLTWQERHEDEIYKTGIGLEEIIDTSIVMMLWDKAGVRHTCDNKFGYNVNMHAFICVYVE